MNEPSCSVERAIGLIGGKWKLYVIRVLIVDGPLRYNQLLESIDGISAKVLTENLRKLEADGVIEHQDELYAATESGKKLMAPLHALGEWAEQHAR